MTVTKRKITEVESIVNKADNRKTAGKIYLPKEWIGKKVKTVLLSSLIVALVGVMTTMQSVNARTPFEENTLKKIDVCWSNEKGFLNNNDTNLRTAEARMYLLYE
jgi:hypothetical protein